MNVIGSVETAMAGSCCSVREKGNRPRFIQQDRKGWPEAFWECGLLPIWEMCGFIHFRGRLASLDEYCVRICANLVQLHGFAGRCRIGHERIGSEDAPFAEKKNTMSAARRDLNRGQTEHWCRAKRSDTRLRQLSQALKKISSARRMGLADFVLARPAKTKVLESGSERAGRQQWRPATRPTRIHFLGK
jgi:hypothetical protein